MAQTKRSTGHAISPDIVEATERLDEQHIFTTKTLGFLIHPNIITSLSSHDGPGDDTPGLKVADIGTGTGIWLLDVAKTYPSLCGQLVGFDVTFSSFPSPGELPSNITFNVQDMHHPFPESEIGTYDIVAVRFVSSATSRVEWESTAKNLVTLLKPGGWLQWIDSCNFSLYCSVPGTSRKACQEIWDGLEPYRLKGGDDLVIGLMMREGRAGVNREDIGKGLGLVEVHEDVFSSDRLQDGPPGLEIRKMGTKNVMECFVGCLESLFGAEDLAVNGWTRDKIKGLEKQAMEEIEKGVYHTLDQVCIIGRKATGPGSRTA
ncbi:S-adenosyl-L-methionine-dependent methyltransferase [Rhypophila decipiens]|uniref:S-adenosyl-L-methionine-dependent methyltransferase n=1 Tax=Rhypophila decipiens TaxID=261697 RepID=A0AAN6YFJ8_9PEZI|nr:S-adenosyl-L-methionine-dependent methyltransferase [Rhypophila decipiens]